MRALIFLGMAGIIGFTDVTAQSVSAESAPQARVLQLEADVRFLSHDMLEGREAGTRGYDLPGGGYHLGDVLALHLGDAGEAFLQT